MQCFLLTGGKEERQAYIQKFIADKGILGYNIYRFTEKLKISDAREIKKMISVKTNSGSFRLFVIEGSGTIEAQNALLKALEELPSETVFFLSSPTKDVFLPTIISRSFLVSFKQENTQEDPEFRNMVNEVMGKPSLNSFLKLSDAVFSNKEDEGNYEKLVLSFRKILLSSIASSNNGTIKQWGNILYDLNKNYGIVKKNNINKRFLFEKIFLKNLEDHN